MSSEEGGPPQQPYEGLGAFAADMEPVLDMLGSAPELPEQLALAEDLRRRMAALGRALEMERASPLKGRPSRGGGDEDGGGDAAEAVGGKRARGAGRGGRRGKRRRWAGTA